MSRDGGVGPAKVGNSKKDNPKNAQDGQSAGWPKRTTGRSQWAKWSLQNEPRGAHDGQNGHCKALLGSVLFMTGMKSGGGVVEFDFGK